MQLTHIYCDVKSQWPQIISTGDCQLTDDGEGLSCYTLDQFWWQLEENCVHGEWGRLMCWGIFCGLKRYIRRLPLPYPESIAIDCLDLEYAIEKIEESINSPNSAYYPERDKYENDLHTLLKAK